MKDTVKYEVIVIGGGLAGVSAAISTARLGCKVALVQDRPVLGGNSSSEIRVTPTGAHISGTRRELRETGIIEEMLVEMITVLRLLLLSILLLLRM